jgi:hypothetical protein
MTTTKSESVPGILDSTAHCNSEDSEEGHCGKKQIYSKLVVRKTKEKLHLRCLRLRGFWGTKSFFFFFFGTLSCYVS